MTQPGRYYMITIPQMECSYVYRIRAEAICTHICKSYLTCCLTGCDKIDNVIFKFLNSPDYRKDQQRGSFGKFNLI